MGPKSKFNACFLLSVSYFLLVNGQIKKDFEVFEFAGNGLDADSTSFATLTEHQPDTTFPNVFTICWRSRNSYARGFWPWNYLEIPSKSGERLMAFNLKDNATTNLWVSGSTSTSIHTLF